MDNSGEVARQFVLNLKAAIGDQSNRAVERLAGVNDDTIAAILQGETWPDLDIIARLEKAFGVVLWPGLVDDED
jgi:transcriptional regulator with XRE-family HTH domain